MNINNLLIKADDYILNNKNIINILNNSSNINIQNNRKKDNIQNNRKKDNIQNKKNNINKKENDDFFYPDDKYENKLFWCWFIFVNDLSKYYNINNVFKEEQEIKIAYVSKIRENKNKLKEIKLKKTQIENDLVYQKNMSFECLCFMLFA